MLRVYFISIFILCINIIMGQSLELVFEHPSVYSEKNDDQYELLIEGELINHSDEASTIILIRDAIELPEGWTISSCLGVCYEDNDIKLDSLPEFEISPGDTELISFHIYITEEMPLGYSKIKITVYEIINEINFDEALIEAWNDPNITTIKSSRLSESFQISSNMGQFKFSARVPQQDAMQLFLYNTLGKKLHTLENQQLSADKQEIIWNSSDYSPGNYFYQLFIGKEQNSGIVTVK
jgi:hypothetical protein